MWYKSNSLLASYPAIKHKITKETCIFGKKGQIWEYGENTLGVLLYGRRITAKMRKTVDVNIPKGKPSDECFFLVEKCRLQAAFKLILGAKRRGRQLTYAKEFDEKKELKWT